MTLLIAFVLVYQFDMSAWWYPVAMLAWLVHLHVYRAIR